MLLRSAQTAGARPAVLLGITQLHDYAGLAQRAAALAGALRDRLGLQPGERVGLFTHNHPAVLEILFGCWWAGLAVVPVNPKLHPREAHYILAHSGASAAFIGGDIGGGLGDAALPLPELRALIDIDSAGYAALLQAGRIDAPLERAPGDLAWLFYTSGTTGHPKGVMLTHRNLLTMTLCYFSDVDTVRPQDSALYAAPMSHGAGLYCLPHVLAAARHVVPESRGFDPAEILALGRRLRGISMFAAPTMVRRLVEHAAAAGEHGAGLKTIVYGGGPMYLEDIRRALQVLGPRFVQIYGQGESPMTITALARAHFSDTAHPQHLERLASVGVAQSAVEVRIVDGDGHALPPQSTGEVIVRGDSVMAGYWRDAAATAQALREGWLHTGDVGSLDGDGFLTLRDRSKDVIISGGSNIYPREVEEVLLRHPAVAEVSVIGRRDAEWGEVVVAFIVARPGAVLESTALDALCQQHIARFKRPKEYHFVDALPKNHYGKVLKTELRARLAATAPPA
nr:AMP-binding protein [Aquabacterium terrae]